MPIARHQKYDGARNGAAIAYQIFCYPCKPMQISRWIEFPARRYRLLPRRERPTCRGTGSCEAGLTPATLPAEPSRSPTTGMPCVKMPPCLCAQIVCVCVSCVRDVGCVKRASILLLPSIALSLSLSLSACVPRAQHHLSFLSPSSILPSPPFLIPLDLWDFVLSLSSLVRVFHSRLLSSVPLPTT